MQTSHPEIRFAAIEISQYATERLRQRGFHVYQGSVTDPTSVESCRDITAQRAL
jgi:hypothetical protein